MNRRPGSVYKNRNRYWWAVRLPGEPKRKARPLIPPGDTLATDNLGIAESLADQMWAKADKPQVRHEAAKPRLLPFDQARRILRSLATEFRQYAAQGDLSYYEISLARDPLHVGGDSYDDGPAIQIIEQALTKRDQHAIDRPEWSDPDDSQGQFNYELLIAPLRATINVETLDSLRVSVARTVSSIPRLADIFRCDRLELSRCNAIAVMPWWSEVLENLAQSEQHPVIRMKKQPFSLSIDTHDSGFPATFKMGEFLTNIFTKHLVKNEKTAKRIGAMARSKHTWIRSFEAGFLSTSAHAIEWLLDPSIENVPMLHVHSIPTVVF